MLNSDFHCLLPKFKHMHLSKTALGQQAFKERSPQFSARQRSAFIMFDGKKSTDDVLRATVGLGLTQADIDHMLALGFLVSAEPPAPTGSSTADTATLGTLVPLGGMVDLQDAQARYARAYPLATQLTANLGLRGFRLNLAVEAAGSYSQLLALLPKIKEAVGATKSIELERTLAGR